jgi:hypothetical protein
MQTSVITASLATPHVSPAITLIPTSALLAFLSPTAAALSVLARDCTLVLPLIALLAACCAQTIYSIALPASTAASARAAKVTSTW